MLAFFPSPARTANRGRLFTASQRLPPLPPVVARNRMEWRPGVTVSGVHPHCTDTLAMLDLRVLHVYFTP
jgi:hypothetical protein